MGGGALPIGALVSGGISLGKLIHGEVKKKKAHDAKKRAAKIAAFMPEARRLLASGTVRVPRMGQYF
jgi:hypothetical protein